MVDSELKADLSHYLQAGRDALVWKLGGLTEYQIRRPMTPTGTNLLGLVKHMAAVESGYFGSVFDRPFGEPIPWAESDLPGSGQAPGLAPLGSSPTRRRAEHDAEPNADMWATAQESREYLVDLYRRVWVHSDATIADLPLDAAGTVPWWPAERRHPTLHRLLVHVIAETHRHAGHADIVRESIDGAVGLRADNDNMAPGDRTWWKQYRSRLERTARAAGGLGGGGGVLQLRLVARAEDFGDALQFYRDVLGMAEQEAYGGPGGARVVILDGGRATLELSNPAQVDYIDEVEVGRRVAPRFRLALEVDDTAAATDTALAGGATLIAAPRETPWHSLNARLDAPAGMQLTLFQELD